MNTKRHHPYIYIVDDEDEVRNSLSFLMRVAGYQSKKFATAEEFIDYADPGIRGCLILDIRLPGASGLELQQILRDRGVEIPIIFLTGHGDVPMSRQAFRTGAVDFIEKPCNDDILLAAVLEALEHDAAKAHEQEARAEVSARYERLSRRERQIMGLVVQGLSSKQIGKQLFISNRTVEVHREHIMQKMEAESLSALIAMGLELGILEKPATTA
jgi:FixJ family two-component response regulator